MLDNKHILASQYAVKKARSKDIRTEAIGYLIRNRNVLNTELAFTGSKSKKFGESLVTTHMTTNV